jgi:hypothetical protein
MEVQIQTDIIVARVLNIPIQEISHGIVLDCGSPFR